MIFRRAYCDWSRFRDAKGHLHEFGVELVDVPPSTRAGKNSADMRLVIDALELCYAREHINTFVIASGDSDFCPLAYKLRENDQLVIGLGGQGGDLAPLRQGLRRVHLPARPGPGRVGRRASRPATRRLRPGQRRRASRRQPAKKVAGGAGHRARGRLQPAVAGHRPR